MFKTTNHSKTSQKQPKIQKNSKKLTTISPTRSKHRTNRTINQITSRNSSNTTDNSMSDIESVRLYTKDDIILPNFDYVVVGAGSGGIASARRAASYGAKVAVIEGAKLGGTCVNVGCVPKKLMWYAANIGHGIHDAEAFGFDQLIQDDGKNTQFNWKSMKDKRDKYLHRLNSMYYRNSMRDGIYIIRGNAEFALDKDGNADLTTLIINKSDPNKADNSDKYLDGFKIEEFKGKEVFVNENRPIKIKINSTLSPASYKGSKIDHLEANTTPLVAQTNFITTAPGGYPSHLKFTGKEHVADSNNFFAWETQPRRVCVTGGGYIGVELSQVMALIGSHVTYVIRGKTVLQSFDHSLTEALMPELEKQCTMVKESALTKVVKLTAEDVKNKGIPNERGMNELEQKELFTPNHPSVSDHTAPEHIYAVYAGLCKDGDGCPSFLGYYDVVLSAVGRAPATHVMNIPTSVTTKHGHVLVDEMGHIVDENAKNIFAVGDVLGKSDLTPVAISYGRRVSDWLFGGKEANPLIWHDRNNDEGTKIPSVVFSHPPIGSCGLSTAEAEKAYGKDKIRVWNAKFTPMYCSLLEDDAKFQAVTKIITTKEFCNYTQKEEDVVIGIHMLFPGADECMQGFAICVANRLPKSFIDNTIAIHPSAAEELVLFR
jgi:glutathione reductase (NADPH)